MDRDKKIALLEALQNGKMTLAEFEQAMQESNSRFKAVIWQEVEFGVFKNAEGQVYSEDLQNDPNTLNVMECNFHRNGERIKKPTSSEKELQLAIERELLTIKK